MRNRLMLPIAFLSLVSGGLLAGCGQSDVSWQGPEDKLVKKVKPGKTTEAEVTGLFGQPVKTEMTPTGTKILQYEALKMKADAADSPVGPAETVRRERYVYFFEINQGIVVRAWKTHATLEKHTAVDQPLFCPPPTPIAAMPTSATPPMNYAPPPANSSPVPVAAPQPTYATPPSAASAPVPPPGVSAPPPMAYSPGPYPAPAYGYPAPPVYYYPAPPAYYYYAGPVVYPQPCPCFGLNLGFRFGWRR